MNTVEAVKTAKQVSEVGTLLRHYGGELYEDIWAIGINLTLRISDLLAIKYVNIDLENRCYFMVEAKTGKRKELRLNRRVIEVISRRREQWPDDVYLFQVHSNRSKGKPPSREHVSRMFKDVGERMKIKLGTHSMRKTRGHAMYKEGVNIVMICKALGHSSPATTLRYIGIEREDVLSTYDDFVL